MLVLAKGFLALVAPLVGGAVAEGAKKIGGEAARDAYEAVKALVGLSKDGKQAVASFEASPETRQDDFAERVAKLLATNEDVRSAVAGVVLEAKKSGDPAQAQLVGHISDVEVLTIAGTVQGNLVVDARRAAGPARRRSDG